MMKRIRTLTTMLFAAFFASVLFAVPAAAKGTVTPGEVVIPMPVLGEGISENNYIALNNIEGAADAMCCFFKLNPSGARIAGSQTMGPFESGSTYEAFIQIAYLSENYSEPGTDGWSVRLQDVESMYSYAADPEKTTVQITSGPTRWYVQISAKGILPAQTVKDITLEYGGDWDLEPGDLPNFDITVPEADRGLYDMPGDEPEYANFQPYWEIVESVYRKDGKIEPLIVSDRYWMYVKLLPTNYLPVVLRDPLTCNVPSGDVALYDIKEQYDKSGKRCFMLRFKIHVVNKIKSLNITGIREPKAGEMPKTDGIKMAVPGDLPDEIFEIAVKDTPDLKWSGNFNADGSFKESESYTLQIPYRIKFDSTKCTFYSEKGFSKKVTAGSGVLVSDSGLAGEAYGDSISEERVMVLSFKAPREHFNVTFDANGGSGSMEAVVVKAGDAYVLPGCGFNAPAGKIFKKWDQGEVGAKVTVNQDLVVKAVWGDPAAMDIVDLGDQGTYQITNPADASGKKGTVAFQKPAFAPGSKSEQQVTVPDTIIIFNIKYTVESVADNAFSGNTKLKKVVIGKNVKKIGKNAFAGCTDLQTVICKSKILTKIGEGAFKGDKKLKAMSFAGTKLKAKNVGKDAIKGTSKKLVIKAPSKAVKAYKSLFKKKGNKKVKVKKLK